MPLKEVAIKSDALFNILICDIRCDVWPFFRIDNILVKKLRIYVEMFVVILIHWEVNLKIEA